MNRLKELRQQKNDTQVVVAEAMGVTRRGYQKWENGESQIKPEKAQQLADYFGVSVAYLLGYTDNGKIYDDEKVIEINDETVAFSFEKFQEEEAEEIAKNFIRFLSDYGLFLSNIEIIKVIELLYSLSTNHGDDLKTKVFQEIFTNPDHKYYNQLFEEYSCIFGDTYERNDLEQKIHGYFVDETKTKAKSEKLLKVLEAAYGKREYTD